MAVDPSPAHLICPSCDAELIADATADRVCPQCGARLVMVRLDDDLVGKVLDGRFEIRDRIGEGGMGTVYRAWQRSIGREIAVKLIDRRFARDVMAVKRFLREARLASQLSQPNTVSVLDFGQCDDGRLFIAMELVRGRTLDRVLTDDGAMSVSRAARIGAQLCDALHAAHRLHIVHRDLKPSNVICLDDPPGRDLVKVLDFGLAKSLAENESQRTDTGVIVGTPRYLAPEVAAGASATPAADLYALGVLLGELVAGKSLWEATGLTALLAQKLSRSPVLDEVPPPLRELVARLVDPDPAVRPTSAAAVGDSLRAMIDPSGVASAPGAAPDASMHAALAETVATPRPRTERSQTQSPPTVALRRGSPSTPPAAVTEIPARPRRAIAIGIAAVATIGAVVAVLAMRGEPPPTVAAIAVADARPVPVAALVDAAIAAPDAAEPETVTLRVTSRPAGATLRVAGQTVGVTPQDVPVPRGSELVLVEIERDGRTASRKVVPDRDRDVELVLPTRRAPTEQTPF